MPLSNVVITGLGVVSSIGIGCEDFFASLLAKRSGICSLSQRTDDGAKPGVVSEPAGLWIGGPILDFDPKVYVRPRKALKVMCREIQTAFAASQLAIDHAGLSEKFPASPEGEYRPSDVGTVFGNEMFYGPPSEMEDAIKHCMRPDGTIDESIFGSVAMRDVLPLWMLKYLPNMPACHVGIALNAHGPNNSLLVGDISGPAALIEAASCLQRGIAKVMVSGGSGTRINTTRMNYRDDLPIPEVSDPIALSSRPHDPTSVGVVGGEGAATIVLERPADAVARGGKGIVKIKSYASRFVASGGMGKAKRSAAADAIGERGSSRAIELAIVAALRDAGLTAQDIGMVVSHAMGDPVMDNQERDALQKALPGVPLVAPIAALGHTGAACGTIGIVVGSMSLAARVIPPTLNADTSDVGLLNESTDLRSDHVLCLSHTSEGNAMAIILATNDS